MPNYCGNTLEITGTEEDVQRFYDENRYQKGMDFEYIDMKGNKIDVNEIWDMNENYDFVLELTFHRAIPIGPWNYDVAVEKWGCKWDCDMGHFEKDSIGGNQWRLTYTFSTPWSPPHEWFDVIGEKYNTLEIKIESEEPGNDFVWIKEYKNGEVENEENHTYTDFIYEKYRLYREMNIILHKMNRTGLFYLFLWGCKNIPYFDYEGFMNLDESDSMYAMIQNQPKLWEDYQELKTQWTELEEEYDNKTNILNMKMDEYIENAFPRINRFLQKIYYQLITKKQILKNQHQKKYNFVMDELMKMAYLPPYRLLSQDIKDEFKIYEEKKIWENGGFIFQQILSTIE